MTHVILRRAVAVCAAAALALGLRVPAPSAAREAHVLRYADSLDVTTLNPLLATSGNIVQLSELALAHLVRLDEHGNPTPELLTVVPTQSNGGISRDGKTLIWHLRRGVRWSDGAPFGADDVVFTINTILNPANNIVSRAGYDQITSARARDPYTVEVRLKAPFAPASIFFASNDLSCILPKHLLASLKTINDAPYNALPVGIGPFKFTSFKRGDSVTLDADPSYFRGRPKLDRVVYKIITDSNTLLTQMRTGELDLWVGATSAYFDRLKTLPGKNISTILSTYRSGIYFNTQRPSVSDPAVRRALRFATDREAIFDKALHRAGVRTESIFAPVSLGYDRTLPIAPYDPAKANALLDAAGWKRAADGTRAKGGVPLSVEIAIPSGSEASTATVELVRDNWTRVGVRVETRVYSVAQFFAPFSAGGILQTGKFDGAFFSQGADPMNDLSGGIECHDAPPNGLNSMRYCNHDVDAAVERYRSLYDPAGREPIGRVIQRRVDEDAPVVMIYQRYFIFSYDSALKNFHPHTWEVLGRMMDVDI